MLDGIKTTSAEKRLLLFHDIQHNQSLLLKLPPSLREIISRGSEQSKGTQCLQVKRLLCGKLISLQFTRKSKLGFPLEQEVWLHPTLTGARAALIPLPSKKIMLTWISAHPETRWDQYTNSEMGMLYVIYGYGCVMGMTEI